MTEIIGNSAKFQKTAIADALIQYFSTDGRMISYDRRTHDKASSKYSPKITGRLDPEFLRLANLRFLDFIVEYCCDKNSPASDLLVVYAAVELYERMIKLEHQTYEKALAVYKSDIFTFAIEGGEQAKLEFLNLVLQNRMKDFKAVTSEATE